MKKWFIAIFILTIIDALCTMFGIKAGFIREANPILQAVFHTSPEMAAAIIVVFVGAMLLLIYKYRGRIRWINYGVAGLAIVKLWVVGLHINWISQVI